MKTFKQYVKQNAEKESVLKPEQLEALKKAELEGWRFYKINKVLLWGKIASVVWVTRKGRCFAPTDCNWEEAKISPTGKFIYVSDCGDEPSEELQKKWELQDEFGKDTGQTIYDL